MTMTSNYRNKSLDRGLPKCVVLKVQKPIRTNEPIPMWLFYNRDRTIFFQRGPTSKEVEAMGDELKIYAEYSFKNGRLRFSRRAIEKEF